MNKEQFRSNIHLIHATPEVCDRFKGHPRAIRGILGTFLCSSKNWGGGG